MFTTDTRVQSVHMNTALNVCVKLKDKMLALSNHFFKSMQYNGGFMAVQMTIFQIKYLFVISAKTFIVGNQSIRF